MHENTIFEQWASKEYGIKYSSSDEKELRRELEAIGIHIESIFSIKNPQEIRILTSELVVKRDFCTAPDFNTYKFCLELLLLYAEYLDSPKQKQPQNPYSKDKTRDSLVVAYYLSRFNREALTSLGYHTFSEAFKSLGNLLGQKSTTIKNMRDEFDPYFDNGRAGWYQKELTTSRRQVFEEFKNMNRSEVEETVNTIINAYSEPKPQSNSPHKTIKLSSGNMKEIKSKRKM